MTELAERTPPDPALVAILVCPVTRSPLRYDADAHELVADGAGLAYPVRAGVPVLIAEAARRTGPAAGAA